LFFSSSALSRAFTISSEASLASFFCFWCGAGVGVGGCRRFVVGVVGVVGVDDVGGGGGVGGGGWEKLKWLSAGRE